MPTRYTIKQLAEFAEFLRYQRHKNGARPEDIMEFEYRKGDQVGLLKNVRFGRSESGKSTTKTIDCIDSGTERSYDGKYDFEITAFLAAGERIKDL